jgi:preprotein translocase subunit SecG
MIYLLTTIHVIVCLFLVVVVLLQSGKAADLAGAFGGMGSQTVFGPRGSATVLSKATTIAAALFMITSLSLSIMATRSGGAVPAIFEKKAPAQPKNGKQQLPPPVGSTVPIGVTPLTNGVPGQPSTVPLEVQKPLQPAPQGQKK